MVHYRMQMRNELTAAVLAGGKSIRFGSSKLEAVFRGRRLIDTAIDTACEISSNIMIIADFANLKTQKPVSIYSDVYKNKGPLAGIHSALQHAPDSAVAVLPADMPFLTAEVYRYLLQFFTNERPVAAESDKGLEPWCQFGQRVSYRKLNPV